MTDHLAAVTQFAERDCRAFPCSPTTGAPLTPNGFHDATTDIDRLRRYWKKNPHAAIGLATGHTISVLDIDHTDFAEGVADLPDCITDGGPVARSGGGKWHLYFRPAGIGRRIRFSKWCDWLDGDGYVIAPPSRHKSGGTYTWFAPFDLELQAAPAELLEVLHPKPTPAPPPPGRHRQPFHTPGKWSPVGLIGRVATATEGNRNDVLHWAAHRAGLDVRNGKATRSDGDNACQELERIAHMIGLGEKETRLTITSGYGAGLAGKVGKKVAA